MMTPKWLMRIGLFLRSNLVTIAMSITVISVMLTLVMIAFEANKIQQQLAADNQILSSLETITGKLSTGATQRTDQYNALNRHLDCLAAFFAEPDRAGKTISDIDTCTLQDNKTGSQTVTPTSDSNSNAQVTPVSTPQTGTTSQPTSNNVTSQKVGSLGLIETVGNFFTGIVKAL